MKEIPDKNILLFRSCLVSVEYPGVEASTKFVLELTMQFLKSKHAVLGLDITLMSLTSCPHPPLGPVISE